MRCYVVVNKTNSAHNFKTERPSYRTGVQIGIYVIIFIEWGLGIVVGVDNIALFFPAFAKCPVGIHRTCFAVKKESVL